MPESWSLTDRCVEKPRFFADFEKKGIGDPRYCSSYPKSCDTRWMPLSVLGARGYRSWAWGPGFSR
ncbi:MAG: hypothetical protein GY820_31580 [Gammaproteobacteria bacterium]|nr:hypothetical protein [Gammaproteobacteria bacterium]